MMARNGRGKMLIVALVLLFVVACIATVGVGAVKIPPGEVWRILLHKIPLVGAVVDEANWPSTDETIILQLRLPRMILSGLVGAGLAVAGAAFQALFKNPMADPYIIGVSSGASLGAVLAMVTGINLGFADSGAVPASAFLFALVTVYIVYCLARTGEKVPTMSLLLAGIAVGSFLSAIVSFLTFISSQKLHQVIYWLIGGFSGRGWDDVRVCASYMVTGLVIIFFLTRELNAMLLGEEPAQHLGIEVETVKKVLIFAASLLTAAAVAVSGMIGFVGLVIPHIVRLVVGPDHRVLLPATALAGALFLVGADALARTVMAPGELPVGIITALVGGPFFIYLLQRKKNTFFQ